MNLDSELLEYLLLSDFVEDNDPDRLRNLLKSFRYFYRYQSGTNQSLKNDIDKVKYDLNIRNLRVLKLESDLKNEQQRYNNLINKKLTIRERLFGKLNK